MRMIISLCIVCNIILAALLPTVFSLVDHYHADQILSNITCVFSIPNSISVQECDEDEHHDAPWLRRSTPAPHRPGVKAVQ